MLRVVLPKTAKGDRTRTSLIEKATIRFARDGFNQTNLSDIARDVGIKPASIYAYFEDKHDLFLSALNVDNASLFDKIDEVILDDFSQDWNLSFEKILNLVELHPLTKRVLVGGEEMASARLEVLPAETVLIEKLVAKIKSGQMCKIIRSDIDPELIVDGIVTIFTSLLIAALQSGGSGEFQSRIPGVVAVFEASLFPLKSGGLSE